jgi:hypothetical protein
MLFTSCGEEYLIQEKTSAPLVLSFSFVSHGFGADAWVGGDE